MFSSLSEGSWLADQAAPGPPHLGTVNDTRPFLDGDDFRAAKGSIHTNEMEKKSYVGEKTCEQNNQLRTSSSK